jgi:hypothetical protein
MRTQQGGERKNEAVSPSALYYAGYITKKGELIIKRLRDGGDFTIPEKYRDGIRIAGAKSVEQARQAASGYFDAKVQYFTELQNKLGTRKGATMLLHTDRPLTRKEILIGIQNEITENMVRSEVDLTLFNRQLLVAGDGTAREMAEQKVKKMTEFLKNAPKTMDVVTSMIAQEETKPGSSSAKVEG